MQSHGEKVQKVFIKIEGIPAVLWGASSEKAIIAVHGNFSDKLDVPIEIFAATAEAHGYQVISFDLPEHGERKAEGIPCKPQYCIPDLMKILQYTKKEWPSISLFANSIGAYFSLLAYERAPIVKAWFLSPVTDMLRMIENIMARFQVTEGQLRRAQAIPTPMGPTLFWDYYCYVKEHPILRWDVPTEILFGSEDTLCEFAGKFSGKLKIVPGAEHYFHTPEQLQALQEWLEATM